MNELQTFSNGDTNYIQKHNANYTNLKAAVEALENNLAAQVAAASGPGSAFDALFGPTAAIIGAESYAATGSGGTLTIAPGFNWKPSVPVVVRNPAPASLPFTGLASGTYYIYADKTGAPVRNSSAGVEDLYSVVWTGSAFGAITRIAPVVWGAADDFAAQVSTALGETYDSLDARLEAGETAAVAGSLARAWQIGRLTKNVSGGTDVTLTGEEVNHTIVDLTGALTANINVVVPLGTAPRLWLVTNNTTGAYTVTVKGATGTGVVVAQGGEALLSQDDTNVFAVGGVGSGAVMSINAVTPDGAGNVTLAASDVGADPAGAATSSVSAHVAASDPHPQYMTQAESDARYAAAAGAVSDGDKGDIVVSGSGAAWSIDSGVLSTFGRTLIDDADAATARATLGLGSAATLTADTDTALAANSDTRTATQKAVKAYIDSIVTGGASDVMIFKGVIDCSINPTYPSADAGSVYKVSVAGKIGGSSGPNVEAGDTLYCITDATAAGTHATVGGAWVIAQANIDGAVTGPASATDNALALFNGTTGKTVKDSGVSLSTDGTFAGNSDALVPTQKAVKTYVASAIASGGGGTPGGSTTQIQFNDGGAFGGDDAFTWDKTNNILYLGNAAGQSGTIKPPSNAGATGAVGISLLGGDNTATSGSTAHGGTVTIKGGQGGSGSGSKGGNVVINGGAAQNGYGGAVLVTAGAGVGTSSQGGAVTITSGAGSSSGNAGVLTLQQGDGQFELPGAMLNFDQFSNVILQGGTARVGNSGASVTISSGSGNNVSNSGQLTIQNGANGNFVSNPAKINFSIYSNVSMNAGDITSGPGGSFTIAAGKGSTGNPGGPVTITAGSVTGAGNGGAISLTAGAGGTAFGTGGDVSLTAGVGTGSGYNGGNIVLTPGAATGTGTRGHVVLNGTGAALATGATGGFTCLPTCAGTPTGTPTAVPAGCVAMVVDTTNSKLYIYLGGWKSVPLA